VDQIKNPLCRRRFITLKVTYHVPSHVGQISSFAALALRLLNVVLAEVPSTRRVCGPNCVAGLSLRCENQPNGIGGAAASHGGRNDTLAHRAEAFRDVSR
jgi:hypothetical protein